MDQRADKPALTGWRLMLEEPLSRLRATRALLSAVVIILLVFLAFGSLNLLEVLVAIVAAVLVAALVPQPADAPEATTVHHFAAGDLDDTTVEIFANALADPCIILDRRSIVVHRNAAAANQFPSAAIGNPIAFSLRYPGMLAAIDAARRTGAAQSVELHQTVPNETWHQVAIAPLTAHALAENELAPLLVVTMQSLTEARRVDALRSDFIANASHELRTPLTSLIGFIDTLLGPAARDAEARERFLGIMRAQASRMSKLIDDLLSLSRIEMRQHVRPNTTVDLSALLREVNDGLMAQAADASVAVSVEVPEAVATVTGDRDELYEVFENLIDNAIKYGGDGGKVEVSLVTVNGRPGYEYSITVTDHGAGIEAEHVPRLTERFYQVDAESSRKKKGTGLGLAIVKHILNRHRGLMTIRSSPGQGMRVEVLLPK